MWKCCLGLARALSFQGCVFFIFINALPETVKKSFTGLFCDDTLISKEITCESDAVELQNDMNNVYEWAEKWGMKFNAIKSVVMTVSNKTKPLHNTYYIKNMLPVQCLAKKNFIKYLGVSIDNKLTFKKHIQEKCNNATRVLNMMRRNLHFAPKSIKCKAYMTSVRPILEYASTSVSYTHLTLPTKA